eukprot:TRINITY_DN20786_c0_g1_i1.p1 TRINITY_DN20786_c0_g1~~TRINITY_DN20786_c0_g1_i1.p1  ORF type:complete len:305 (-),score=24.37 TRINITY_DN20786_c0_g1_i1:53-967(-)
MGNNILYAAPIPSYHPSEYRGEILWILRKESNLEYGIPCFFLQHAGASHIIVFFHANAEDLGQIYVFARHLRSLLGVHVLAVEYPGYGICSGVPSESVMLEDADTVMHFLKDSLGIPVSKIIVLGRSIGGGPAIYLASKYDCGGLITIATFTSIRAVVGRFASIAGLFVDIFDNETRIRSVSCPTLILHGDEDTIVDVLNAYYLAEACGAEQDERPPVTIDIRQRVGHNNFDVRRDVVRSIQEAFPQLKEGDPISLERLGLFMLMQPSMLALDVSARVAYASDWTPAGPPQGSVRIILYDGTVI